MKLLNWPGESRLMKGVSSPLPIPNFSNGTKYSRMDQVNLLKIAFKQIILL